MSTILFVCTGNTCRSPMAEAIARHWVEHDWPDRLPQSARPGSIGSAGVAAGDGVPVSPGAVEALAALGLEHTGRSTQLTGNLVRGASHVLCMTSGHVSAARSLAEESPEWIDRIQLLDPGADIADPIGMDAATYLVVARKLAEVIPARLEELLSHEDRAGV